MSKKARFRFGRFGRLAAALMLAFAVLVTSGLPDTRVRAHGFGSPITWNREISRLVYARCASCHRPGGTAFSLMKFTDAQPRANEIKDAVLARRMPPWGAIKGFGQFRNDQSLTPEQIELITKWVDGGIQQSATPSQRTRLRSVRRAASAEERAQGSRFVYAVTRHRVGQALPERLPPAQSTRIIAVSPGGVLNRWSGSTE